VLRHAGVISSTNDWARQEVESGTLHAPALLVADSQSAGRGRGANTWWSACGNVAATFVVTHNQHVPLGLVPLLAGLAVRRALVRLTGCEEISLKWPNDLAVGRRKAAGLLCERLRSVDLIGVGVNVNVISSDAPVELRDRITSLRELTGSMWDLTDVVAEINHSLDEVLSVEAEDAVGTMLQEYSLHHWPTGKMIELTDTDRIPWMEGRCDGIDTQGRLIVNNDAGTHAILTGCVVSVRFAADSV
jgi:BirA family biotin operon repressor/biotin-[acetyl-CoA-carboxylase] ligase